MKPATLKLAIGASLFIVIIWAFGFWFVTQMPMNPQIPVAKAEIEMPPPEAALDPTVYSVPFCELLKNPKQYNRKLIRTRAVFDNGVDWPSFRHDDCPDDDNVVGASAAVEPNDRIIEAQSPRRIGIVVNQLLREKWEGPLEVDADMLGRFYVKPEGERQFAIVYEFEARPTRKRWEK